MKLILVSLFALTGLVAHADEQTCAMKDMTCEGCVAKVQEKLCTEDYATCEVKVGQVHLKSKDPSFKIEKEKINAALKDLDYKAESCVKGAPKAEKKKKSA